MGDVPEIETQRLGLRRLTPRDAGPVTEAVNDPRIYLMLASIAPRQSKAETLAWFATHDAARQNDTGHIFGVVSRQTGALAGLVSANRKTTGEPFNIGYWMKPEFWGAGFCTEATGGLVGWLENTRAAAALVSGYFSDNPASGKVLRKLGFLPCGRNAMFSKGRGQSSDHIMMARIA